MKPRVRGPCGSPLPPHASVERHDEQTMLCPPGWGFSPARDSSCELGASALPAGGFGREGHVVKPLLEKEPAESGKVGDSGLARGPPWPGIREGP